MNLKKPIVVMSVLEMGFTCVRSRRVARVGISISEGNIAVPHSHFAIIDLVSRDPLELFALRIIDIVG